LSIQKYLMPYRHFSPCVLVLATPYHPPVTCALSLAYATLPSISDILLEPWR